MLSGGPTWQSALNWSPTLPSWSKITPARVAVRQRGPPREVIPSPSFAKSQCGEPPTASIPKTRDQPEEAANSIQPLPCGNSDSTGRSPVPPIHHATTGSTNDRQHKPHRVGGVTTASDRTKHPVSVQTGQPHPAANHRP